jgi:hypothetical protein
MYSTVEDLFLWNQALYSDRVFPSQIREQMFKPAMNNWAGGWFVTKIPPGTPGSGGMLAEMRGDMPGNFFAWILRYPEQDAVIIVLRNAYGSTEHLEQNLQAILFDQPPRFPSRSPKDMLAKAGFGTYAAFSTHPLVWPPALVLVLAGMFYVSIRRRIQQQEPTANGVSGTHS